jgi:multidrug efflux system outer membrane protein
MLLASVRAGGVEADLAGARGDHRLARSRLALVMGTPADTAFVLPNQLPDTATILRLAGDPGPDAVSPSRGDVRAAARALEAARADVVRAWSLYLPRINGFGRLEWNAPDSPFSGRDAWTIGVMVSWSPFAGASELAERRAARGRQESAEAAFEAARAQAAQQRQQAESDHEVALARMTIAARSVDQAGEAHRIVTRRYEAGLATAVELFDAAAQETRARLASAAARYAALVAVAERDRADGQDLSSLATLDMPRE